LTKLSRPMVLVLALTAVIALAAMPSAVRAEPGLSFEGVWARAASEGHTSAVYMHIANEGGRDAVFVAAAADVAELVEIHETTIEVYMEDGRFQQVMRMQQIPQLVVPAGGRVELRPGGLHIMLIGLTRDLEEGDSFSLTLYTEDGQEHVIHVPVTVGVGMDDHDHHDHHDHHHDAAGHDEHHDDHHEH